MTAYKELDRTELKSIDLSENLIWSKQIMLVLKTNK